MNKIKLSALALIALVSFSACSSKSVELPKQSEELKQKIITKNIEVDKYKKEMLKNNENYSEKHLKQSLYENYKTNDEKPLYKNPEFAVITIFPYVSDDGIYHEYERVWVKIKDGNFILKQNIKKARESKKR